MSDCLDCGAPLPSRPARRSFEYWRRRKFCSTDCQKAFQQRASDPKVFFSLGIRVGECLEWPGTRDKDGYGVLVVEGRPWRTHRYAFFLHKGSLDNRPVLHSCDNSACFEGSHLRQGTPADNITDMFDRGRNADLRGQLNGGAKLTENEALLILRDPRKTSVVAAGYSVSSATVRAIKRRSRWGHLCPTRCGT